MPLGGCYLRWVWGSKLHLRGRSGVSETVEGRQDVGEIGVSPGRVDISKENMGDNSEPL